LVAVLLLTATPYDLATCCYPSMFVPVLVVAARCAILHVVGTCEIVAGTVGHPSSRNFIVKILEGFVSYNMFLFSEV
jgi:hypothetical protein